ncbi:MAG: FAD binding domain-containing protein [Burkholderiales bacterium]|nr:FAD binding domain-containing protein [Burkholderiales bacterium]
MRSAGDFDVLRPATLADAAVLLLRPGAMPLAGGTDLMPNLRRGLHAARWIVDLGGVAEFGRIERDAAGWSLGAGVTLARLERHAELARELRALVQAAGAVAGPGHRTVATLGGNLCQDTRCIHYNQSAWWREANGFCLKHGGDTCHVAPQGQRCHAAYEGDLAAPLLAYGAEVEIVGALTPRRRVPLAALYRDDGAAHLSLAEGELLAAVHVPHVAPGTASAYHKARVRMAMDFPLAGVAVALRVDARGCLAALSVGISGTNSHPLRLAGTEDLLERPVDDAALHALGRLVARQVTPMRSTVTASNHRRLAAVAAAERLLGELAGLAALAPGVASARAAARDHAPAHALDHSPDHAPAPEPTRRPAAANDERT